MCVPGPPVEGTWALARIARAHACKFTLSHKWLCLRRLNTFTREGMNIEELRVPMTGKTASHPIPANCGGVGVGGSCAALRVERAAPKRGCLSERRPLKGSAHRDLARKLRCALVFTTNEEYMAGHVHGLCSSMHLLCLCPLHTGTRQNLNTALEQS